MTTLPWRRILMAVGGCLEAVAHTLPPGRLQAVVAAVGGLLIGLPINTLAAPAKP